MAAAGWLNAAWMLACAPEALAFRRATRHVAAVQERLLLDTVRHNAATEFGRRHHFDRVRSAADFRAAVPLSRAEDYAEAIARIADGAPAVLTAEPVRLLEPTSGTTGGEKLVPYTAALRRQFQRAVAAWVGDLLWQQPRVRAGRAYWSISPAGQAPRVSCGGIPIGFDDDTAYLGTCERWALRRLLIAPPAARSGDPDTFRRATLAALLAAPDLALISVWSPTFLTSLFARLDDWREALIAALPVGHQARVAAVLRSAAPVVDKLRRLWPQLAVISCWADAAAAQFLPALRALFPAVEIQPKGLLATEGVVSFPLVGRPAPVLAVRSHYFEFEESGGAVRQAHELDRGGRYRVVLTTGGGLYRYGLRDEVEVVGFENECPQLRFRGKADRVSDLAGEKLAEPHVREVLDRVLAAAGLRPAFALLAPTGGPPVRYVLHLQTADPGPQRRADLAAAVQAGLEENPHYRYAVGLGQLAPVEVAVIPEWLGPAWRLYEQRCLERGQKLGDIKPSALDSWAGWTEVFGVRCRSTTGEAPAGASPGGRVR